MYQLKEKSTIVFQGDSITDGGRYRDNQADKNHDMGQSYAMLISATLGEKYAEKGYTFLNRGISAHRVTDLYSRWQEDTIFYNPSILSILVGVNDVSYSAWDKSAVKLPDRYEAIYRLLLEETFSVLPEVKIVLIEPFVLKSELESKERMDFIETITYAIKDKQRIVRQLAKEYNCIFVPTQEAFDAAATRNSPNYFVWDGVHPTFVGHKIIADLWMEAVQKEIQF